MTAQLQLYSVQPMQTLFSLILLAATTSTPIERKPFEIPSYDSTKGIERYATQDEYAAAASDTRFHLEKVTYPSGDLQVFAYLYEPVKSESRLPAVVFNRGSYVRDEFAGELLTIFHRLAEAGFVVLAPMYRQSGGAPGRDEMGGADVDDLMATLDVLRALESVDPENVFMYGESRGGMMTYQAIRNGYPLRAAAVYGAFTDLRALLESSEQARGAATAIWPDFATNADAIYQQRSALMWADKLNTPLLIMHGSADRDVPPAQSQALAAKLKELNKPHHLLIRDGSNHTLSDWRVERDATVIDWFRRHSKPSSSAPISR